MNGRPSEVEWVDLAPTCTQATSSPRHGSAWRTVAINVVVLFSCWQRANFRATCLGLRNANCWDGRAYRLSLLSAVRNVRTRLGSGSWFPPLYAAYEARQEVVVASVWGPRLKPDLLLSLDGANDLEHRLRVKKACEFYLSRTCEAFLSHPLLAPLYFSLVTPKLIMRC